MNNKTAAILTFVVTVLVPFLQELSDFCSAFRSGSCDSSRSDILRQTGFEVSQDLKAASESAPKDLETYVQVAQTKSSSPAKSDSWSRFFNRSR